MTLYILWKVAIISGTPLNFICVRLFVPQEILLTYLDIHKNACKSVSHVRCDFGRPGLFILFIVQDDLDSLID